MSFTPDPTQTLLLWGMLFRRTPEQREPMLSRARPRLTPKRRAELIRAGLLETERRGRATHLIATERAWAWASAHLDSPLPQRSTAGTAVLRDVLAGLAEFLRCENLALARFVVPRAQRDTAPPADRAPAPGASSTDSLPSRVRAAALELSGGRARERVRLCELREALADVPRAALDRELLAMQSGGRLVLYAIDDPLDRRKEDDEAALSVAGCLRHSLYLED